MHFESYNENFVAYWFKTRGTISLLNALCILMDAWQLYTQKPQTHTTIYFSFLWGSLYSRRTHCTIKEGDFCIMWTPKMCSNGVSSMLARYLTVNLNRRTALEHHSVIAKLPQTHCLISIQALSHMHPIYFTFGSLTYMMFTNTLRVHTHHLGAWLVCEMKHWRANHTYSVLRRFLTTDHTDETDSPLRFGIMTPQGKPRK